MKIHIRNNEFGFFIPLPTNLIFSKGTAWLANYFGRKYAGDALKDIPPEALEVLFAEFRRIKKKHGTWELVEVKSARGDRVRITL